jgi:hypothetical protein
MNEHPSPAKLEKYSFVWSELRLVIAALALLLGGKPPVLVLFRGIGIVWTLLNLSWIISGVASAYLLYRWTKHRTLFDVNHKYDVWAFWVMIVSGFNLGIAGIFSTNIGMTISSNYFLFVIVAVIYLASAYRLYKSWIAHHRHVF